MNKTQVTAELEDGTNRIVFAVSGKAPDTPYHLGEREIKGFWSTPAIKTSLTEAQTRNGAHSVDRRVLYSARVVTVPFIISAANRVELDRLKTNLGLFVGRPDVVFRVNDGDSSTFVSGMLTVEYSVDIDERIAKGELTLTCQNAERMSTDLFTTTIGFGATTDGGGLNFGPGRQGLVFPMNFGKHTTTGVRNMVVLKNSGSYAADMQLTLRGPMYGALFEWFDSEGRHGNLEYDGYVSGYQEVLLDSRTESATIAGSDFSGNLRYRKFPRIPAGGSVRVLMLATSGNNGGGFATVAFRDTWM